jgi:hypothetical protein
VFFIKVVVTITFRYCGNPAGSAKDSVRFFIGDTDTNDQKMQDEEINYLLTIFPCPLQAAAMAAESIATQFADLSDKSVGDLKISYGGRASAYTGRAERLWELAKQYCGNFSGGYQIYAGGLSKSDKETIEDDSDRVLPDFERKMNDFPGTTYKPGSS